MARFYTAPAETSISASAFGATNFTIAENPTYPRYGFGENSAWLAFRIGINTLQTVANRTVDPQDILITATLGDSQITAYPRDSNCAYWYVYGTISWATPDSDFDPDIIDETVAGNNYYSWTGSQPTNIGRNIYCESAVEYTGALTSASGNNGLEVVYYFANITHYVRAEN